jgi:hypothetical protein
VSVHQGGQGGRPMTCKIAMFALICAMSLTSFFVGHI